MSQIYDISETACDMQNYASFTPEWNCWWLKHAFQQEGIRKTDPSVFLVNLPTASFPCSLPKAPQKPEEVLLI